MWLEFWQLYNHYAFEKDPNSVKQNSDVSEAHSGTHKQKIKARITSENVNCG